MAGADDGQSPQTRKGINMNVEKTKHTPGPWKVSDKMMTDEMVCRHDTLGAWVYSCRYIEGAGKLLATAQSDEPIGAGRKGGHPQVASRDEMLANARLIAAAPELLAALKRLRDDVQTAHVGADERCKDCAVCWSLKLADAAIAKAEGEG
jgi:hypothetical protein